MSGMSRRDLLRASAGAAAVAVPMSVLARGGGFTAAAASASTTAAAATATDAAADAPSSIDLAAVSGPVMFCVRDARAGEVSILHGDAEVIVRDRQLVERIIHAAQRAAV
jgi:diaminopimelate epimerase